MSEEQLMALLHYIDARIDERVREMDQRESLHESIRRREVLKDLEKAFNVLLPL